MDVVDETESPLRKAVSSRAAEIYQELTKLLNEWLQAARQKPDIDGGPARNVEKFAQQLAVMTLAGVAVQQEPQLRELFRKEGLADIDSPPVEEAE